MKKLLYLFFALSFFVSCEEIPPEIPEVDLSGDRVVLIEEFSGGKCVPCSAAAVILEEQAGIYGDKLVVVTIHSDFGGQYAPHPNAAHNFQTEDGKSVLQSIGLPLGIPSASVNRKMFPGDDDLHLGRDEWPNAIASEVSQAPKANVNLAADFDSNSRELSIVITVIPTENLEGEVRVNALISENNIIDWQASSPDDIEEWEHNHILRSYISPNNGESIGADLALGVPVEKTYTFQVPAEENGLWVAENLELVAFVTLEDSESKQVLQAAKEKLIK